MAQELPVLAIDQGGPAELIETEVSGFLVPQGDQAAYAECLLRLSKDAALRGQMGTKGHQFWEERLQMDKFVARIEQEYANLLAHSSPGHPS